MWLGIIFGIISSAGVLFFLDESPLFLLKTGQIDKAEKIVQRMFKINGTKTTSATEPML